MLRGFLSGSVALLLVGCASAPRPQMMVMPHKAPVVKATLAPAIEAPVAIKPATFKDRWQEFKKKHPIKWTHQ